MPPTEQGTCQTSDMSRPPVPPVERVEIALRELVSGLATDEALPGIRELSEQYGVSPTTVAKALRRLRADGLVTSRKGWGTFKA